MIRLMSVARGEHLLQNRISGALPYFPNHWGANGAAQSEDLPGSLSNADALETSFSARAGPRQAPLKNSRRFFNRTNPETSTAI